MSLLVSIDNGGTLTDVCASGPHGITHVKTLTTPQDLTECFVRGLGALSDKLYGETDLERLISEISFIRYSTTQGTNAIVQRKGPRIGVITDAPAIITKAGESAGDIFSSFVGDRVAEIGETGSEAGLRCVVSAVAELVSRGANRIVVAVTAEDALVVEQTVKRILYDAFPRHLLGAVPLLFSTELTRTGTQQERIWGSILNAFLHPAMEQFLYNAENKLREFRAAHPLLIFSNDGNATRVAKTVALKTYSSGPKGGVVGAEALLAHYGIKNAVSIDIGGTTTDIATFRNGTALDSPQGHIEGAPVPISLTDVESVGVGGGSIIRAVDGQIEVGPDSVGAAPGPACFGRGGDKATITDALLVEHLLDPDSYFGGQLKLDRARAESAIMEYVGKPLGLSLCDAVTAMIDAYEEKIANSIRGRINSTDDILIAFGGAGPMSVCGVAEKAGLSKVLIPRYAAVFSAYGILFSDLRHIYSAQANGDLDAVRRDLTEQARRGMLAEGFYLAECELVFSRLSRTEAGLVRSDDLAAARDGDTIELSVKRSMDKAALAAPEIPKGPSATPVEVREGFERLPVCRLEDMAPGTRGAGPAIIEEAFFTARIPAGWRFATSAGGDIFLERK